MKTKFSYPYTTSASGAENAKPAPLDYDGIAVTPANATNLPEGNCVALYCTGTGNINVTLESGATAVLTGVPANTIIRIACSQVQSTSTTATGIFALY